MNTLFIAAVGVSISLAVTPLSAQQLSESWCGTAGNGNGRVRGIAYDSVTREPLSRVLAELGQVDERGKPLTYRTVAVTDSLGRFCLGNGDRGVPVGRYRLTFMHWPVLGYRRPAPVYREVRVDSGVSTTVTLAYRTLAALDSILAQPIRDSLLGAIRDQRQKWALRRPERYYYQVVPDCLCMSGRVTVIVEGDSVVGFVDDRTGAERHAPSARSLGTMERVFDWLERDVRNPRNRHWAVTWDDQYGFPKTWDADAGVVVIDAYRGASVTFFKSVRR